MRHGGPNPTAVTPMPGYPSSPLLLQLVHGLRKLPHGLGRALPHWPPARHAVQGPETATKDTRDHKEHVGDLGAGRHEAADEPIAARHVFRWHLIHERDVLLVHHRLQQLELLRSWTRRCGRLPEQVLLDVLR
eukprot:UN2999